MEKVPRIFHGIFRTLLIFHFLSRNEWRKSLIYRQQLMCFSYILHFEPRYSADGTTAIWKEWEGSIHGKVVFINILTFYYIPHFCYLYLGSRHKITCTMIRVTLRTQLPFYSNKKYLTVDINKKVWFRRSDDEWAHHGEQILQKKLPDLTSLIWGTLNCK